jgi:hypothetical protein
MAVGDEIYLRGDSNRDGSVRVLQLANTGDSDLPNFALQVLEGGRWRDVEFRNSVGGSAGTLVDGDYGDISITAGLWRIEDGAVDFDTMQNRSAGTFIGRELGAGTGRPQEISAAEAIDILEPVLGPAVAGSLVTPQGATSGRALLTKLADILTPEDFGAIGDNTSHPLSETYGLLATAQVDYPAATALSEQKDWCALKYMFETSGGKNFWCPGKYYLTQTGLQHVIRPQINHRCIWGPDSSVNYGELWAFPVFATLEKRGVHWTGLNLIARGVYDPAGYANGLPNFTNAEFQSQVGAMIAAGGAMNAAFIVAGTDDSSFKRCTIRHANGGQFFCNLNVGLLVQQHVTSGAPCKNLRFHDWVIDDCVHSSLIAGSDYIEMVGFRRNRYDQNYETTWAAGHLIYLTNHNVGHSNAVFRDIVDDGFYTGSDSYPFTTNVGTNLVTVDPSVVPLPASWANDQPIIFLGDKPPAPLIRDKMYYLKEWNSTDKTFKVAETPWQAATPDTTITLTEAGGGSCRVAPAAPHFTINARYAHNSQFENVKSRCGGGLASVHNTDNTTLRDMSYDARIVSGAPTAITATGGTLGTWAPTRKGALQNLRLVVVSGPGRGQKRRIKQYLGTRAFELDTPWDVGNLPTTGSVIEVGTRYQGNVAPLHMPYTVATAESGIERVRFNGLSIMGEFGNNPAIHQDSPVDGTVPKSTGLRMRDTEIYIDISRHATSAWAIFRCANLDLEMEVETTGAWPAGEKGNESFGAGSTGIARIMRKGGAEAFSRQVPAANCDLDLIYLTKNGKPIPYVGTWATLAATRGTRVRTVPVEGLFGATSYTLSGAATTAIANFGALDYSGLYEVTGIAQNTARTEVARIVALVNLTKGTSAQVTAAAVTAIAGTSMSAAAITCTSDGVLSATITHGGTITGATVSWSYRLLHAH